MKWTSIVTRSHYWILGKNVDLSGSPLGCVRRISPVVACFGVLSVWWKTSASVSVLFRAVLSQLPVSFKLSFSLSDVTITYYSLPGTALSSF